MGGVAPEDVRKYLQSLAPREGTSPKKLKKIMTEVFEDDEPPDEKSPRSNEGKSGLAKAFKLDASQNEQVSDDEIKQVFSPTSNSAGGKRLFTIQEIFDGVMALRHPIAIPKWKIVLKQVFQEADKDISGSLSRDEFQKVLDSTATQSKFERIGIDAK